MLSKIMGYLKSIVAEYKQLSAKFKVIFLVLFLLSVWLLAASYAGFVCTPGDPYIQRQFDRANYHFPIYIKLIYEADRAQLEKAFGVPLPKDLDWFKQSMDMEISAWKILIVEQHKVFNKKG